MFRTRETPTPEGILAASTGKEKRGIFAARMRKCLPKDGTLTQVFCPSILTLNDAPQSPSPPHPSSLLKKKKIKTTCHHPPRGINSYLPKKRRKDKKRYGEGGRIMLLYRCGFHPERKTFVVSTCYGIRLLSCSLFLFFFL